MPQQIFAYFSLEFVAVNNHINELDDEISGMSDRVGWIETSLNCPGTSKLEVCGCPNGYTFYGEDCVKSDQTAAKQWMDEFNEGISFNQPSSFCSSINVKLYRAVLRYD